MRLVLCFKNTKDLENGEGYIVNQPNLTDKKYGKAISDKFLEDELNQLKLAL
jgi:hypothetical protein